LKDERLRELPFAVIGIVVLRSDDILELGMNAGERTVRLQGGAFGAGGLERSADQK
jgi:hypothetical protein